RKHARLGAGVERVETAVAIVRVDAREAVERRVHGLRAELRGRGRRREARRRAREPEHGHREDHERDGDLHHREAPAPRRQHDSLHEAPDQAKHWSIPVERSTVTTCAPAAWEDSDPWTGRT